MAINNIPVEASAPHQTITVDLDGETFVLQLDWSEREEAWYLAVKDANEIALVWIFFSTVRISALNSRAASSSDCDNCERISSGKPPKSSTLPIRATKFL